MKEMIPGFESLMADFEGTTVGSYTLSELEMIYRTRSAYVQRAEAERRPVHQINSLKKHRDKALDNIQKARTKRQPAKLRGKRK